MPNTIIDILRNKPWVTEKWWRKERIEIALLQIASITNQRKFYSGWDTLLGLSGFNITATLLILSEIWDAATRLGVNPVEAAPIPERIQTEAIYSASTKWSNKDRNEGLGGSRRFEILGRLGPAIREALVLEPAMSNPGHSGFSLRERNMHDTPEGLLVSTFIKKAVSWAILEERDHTSKTKGDTSRTKWYLHPLLSPAYGIPVARVKEPLYISDAKTVYDWFFTTGKITFRSSRQREPRQRLADTGGLFGAAEDQDDITIGF
jgi:hypothetical protein